MSEIALTEHEFNHLARDIFAHQVRYNGPYAAFAQSLGFDERHLPQVWHEIPAVPTTAFKDATLTTFDVAEARIVFETSGTTATQSGRHYFEESSLALYDASLLAGFDHFVLDREPELPLRYLLLVPERKNSSLGYMMRRVAEQRGDGKSATFVDAQGEHLDVASFVAALARAFEEHVAVCIAGTAFAFAALLEQLDGKILPSRSGSRIMETGGFKGRTHVLERADLYTQLARCFDLAPERIVAEYGMTELTSQYYDAPWSRSLGERVKIGPPWLRPSIVDASGNPVSGGEIGILRHVDLANRGSAVAIQTEDLALRVGEGEFVLLGRDPDARMRGCSLDVEDLLARRG
ncbi:MAG TPA: hypothetical protein VMD07_07710 [Candidatus Acidoferrales bacterium]|nr:hypothetical protein [Candidatus Acidoferrales bacterium]